MTSIQAGVQACIQAASPVPPETPLVIASSRTGNTLLLAHAVAEALPGARLVRLGRDPLPDDLSAFNPVILGFWCDRGRAPEDIAEAAAKLSGKRLGCFATMGGDPEAPRAQDWMRRTSEALARAGEGNALEAVFLSRGRIDPALFDAMTARLGADPEREARRRASESHPDRLDALAAAEAFRGLVQRESSAPSAPAA